MLQWQHDHKEKLEGYRKYREATGEDAHDVQAAPKIDQFTADIWEAWRLLTGSRQYTMGGPAPIAISEIKAYADYLEIKDSDDRDRLLQLISSMDAKWLELIAPKE